MVISVLRLQRTCFRLESTRVGASRSVTTDAVLQVALQPPKPREEGVCTNLLRCHGSSVGARGRSQARARGCGDATGATAGEKFVVFMSREAAATPAALTEAELTQSMIQ